MKPSGFTLSELLIALVILGVIATFTIPKVLTSQQDGKYKAMAKETIATVSQAFDVHRLNGNLSGTTKSKDLMQHMNYVKLDTATTVDRVVGWTDAVCDNNTTWDCYQLHNGGMLFFGNGTSFGGTAPTNGTYFYFDADGVQNGPAGDSILFFIYYDGAIRTYATLKDNTTYNAGTINPDPTKDPPWFNWN